MAEQDLSNIEQRLAKLERENEELREQIQSEETIKDVLTRALNAYDDFIKSDKGEIQLKRNLVMRGRKSIPELAGTDVDNVFELFFNQPPQEKANYIFLGRGGADEQKNATYVELHSKLDLDKPLDLTNGRIILNLAVDGQPEVGEIQVWDSRSFGLAPGSTVVWMASKGANGLSGIGYYTDDGQAALNFYNLARELYLGSNLNMDADETYDIGSSTAGVRTLYAKNADFSDGASGSFTTSDGKTVTVTNGIITNIA